MSKVRVYNAYTHMRRSVLYAMPETGGEVSFETKTTKIYRLGKNPRWYRSKSAAIRGYARWRAGQDFDSLDDPETGYFYDREVLRRREQRIERLLRRLARVHPCQKPA